MPATIARTQTLGITTVPRKEHFLEHFLEGNLISCCLQVNAQSIPVRQYLFIKEPLQIRFDGWLINKIVVTMSGLKLICIYYILENTKEGDW